MPGSWCSSRDDTAASGSLGSLRWRDSLCRSIQMVQNTLVLHIALKVSMLSKYRFFDNIVLDVFYPPSPGIPVSFARVLKESLGGIKYRNRIDYDGSVHRSGIELDSRSTSNTNTEHNTGSLTGKNFAIKTQPQVFPRGKSLEPSVLTLVRGGFSTVVGVYFRVLTWSAEYTEASVEHTQKIYE